MTEKTYSVYILTNKRRNVMYIGMTSNLERRLYEHKHELVDGFTKRYHVHKLVYFEQTTLSPSERSSAALTPSRIVSQTVTGLP